jgi:hypothetical protein
MSMHATTSGRRATVIAVIIKSALVLLITADVSAQTLDAGIRFERTASDGVQDGVLSLAAQATRQMSRQAAQPIKNSNGSIQRRTELFATPRRRATIALASAQTDEIDQLTAKPATRPAYVLRCWQEGRLILQRAVAKLPDAPDARTPNAAVVIPGDSADREMRLFDLKNALCLVQKR